MQGGVSWPTTSVSMMSGILVQSGMEPLLTIALLAKLAVELYRSARVSHTRVPKRTKQAIFIKNVYEKTRETGLISPDGTRGKHTARPALF